VKMISIKPLSLILLEKRKKKDFKVVCLILIFQLVVTRTYVAILSCVLQHFFPLRYLSSFLLLVMCMFWFTTHMEKNNCISTKYKHFNRKSSTFH